MIYVMQKNAFSSDYEILARRANAGKFENSDAPRQD